MPRHRFRSDRRLTGRVNMTPMIDVVFLLLTFFMLASHFASAEKVNVDLPHPDRNQAVDRRFQDKAIISLRRVEDQKDAEIWLGPMLLDSPAELAERLQAIAENNPQCQVILRGDHGLTYGQVREVMEVISAGRLSNLQVVVEMNGNGS